MKINCFSNFIVYGCIAALQLKVFDVLGKEVMSFNEKEEAGYYKMNFDATEYPSGFYFYRLQAGNFVETKKMVLMK